jgi:hypothetical protein
VNDIYVDESVLGSVLGGVVVVLGMIWALWAVGWVRRVELRERLEPTLRALGLSWGADGLGALVRAQGSVEARPVSLELRAPGDVARLRVAGEAWRKVPVGELAATLRPLERAPSERGPPAPG